MRFRQFVLPLAALLLFGCDRITGADVKKNLDAEAIGYACRISLKTPEDCMKENEAQSPTSVLYGWKEADKDIKEKTLDPSMGKPALQTTQSAPATAETTDKAETKTENKAEGKTGKAVESVPAKNEKPVAKKPEKGAAEKH